MDRKSLHFRLRGWKDVIATSCSPGSVTNDVVDYILGNVNVNG